MQELTEMIAALENLKTAIKLESLKLEGGNYEPDYDRDTASIYRKLGRRLIKKGDVDKMFFEELGIIKKPARNRSKTAKSSSPVQKLILQIAKHGITEEQKRMLMILVS